jgi:hypothetical protein
MSDSGSPGADDAADATDDETAKRAGSGTGTEEPRQKPGTMQEADTANGENPDA